MSVATPLDQKPLDEILADMALFPEMNPGPVCRMTSNGTIVLANTKAKTFFGDDHLAGKNWLEILPAIDNATWKNILASNQPYPIDQKFGDVWMSFAHVTSPARDQ